MYQKLRATNPAELGIFGAMLCYCMILVTPMFRSFLRMQFFNPVQMGRMVRFLPQFLRVFWRLYHDSRVSILAKSVPLIAVMMMLTPPALELDMIPLIGELDWLLVGYVALKVFIWLCPPDVVREHVAQISRGV